MGGRKKRENREMMQAIIINIMINNIIWHLKGIKQQNLADRRFANWNAETTSRVCVAIALKMTRRIAEPPPRPKNANKHSSSRFRASILWNPLKIKT